MNIYRHRLLTSLRTLPSPRGWVFCLVVFAATLALMMVIGFVTGLYRLQPTEPGLALRMLVVFFIPAVGEEIPFRGVLTPGPNDSVRPRLEIALSTSLYTLWHVFEAVTFLPAAAPIFLRPDFLLCCAVLGLGCAVMKRRTGSIWPAVILHWALVVIWQTWLGGVSALS